MKYKNIEHNLINVSKKQKYELEIAEIILENINSEVDMKTEIYYDGYSFKVNKYGYESIFIIRILNLSIERDYERFINYVTEHLSSSISSFNVKPNDIENRRSFLVRMGNFFKNYPKNIFSEKDNNDISILANKLLKAI
ncbi:hypothetical protein C8N26_0063 [Tenacibaculum lutimaris]|uniref:Uncharacterized protein n=1 Tax=Tenacibaculum lutimaris TaxID=285258 RepID=A0A420E467_9FLAO|nr:hypothetical protein [Tenacibaculum lutimaris]RKF04677.1 hypothetical protein C8N26_0063 [Tenacibaculum lutimaris]